MKRRWWLVGGLLILLVLVGATAWLLMPPPDLLFRGKPESEWVTGIAYQGSNEQLNQWIGMGPDGAAFLGRALDHRDPSRQRLYRELHRWLPDRIARSLPVPANYRKDRMHILSLLSQMETNALVAEPAVARALRDPDPSVVHIAIGFYCENGVLDAVGEQRKLARLPDFLRAVETGGTSPSARNQGGTGVRNNAAVALREYSGQSDRVVPVLTNALSDPDPGTRAAVCETLAKLDRKAAVRAGVVPLAIELLENPDNQIGYRGADLLRELAALPELSVPALLGAAQGTDTLVASSSIFALSRFPEQAPMIVPVLTNCLTHTNGAVRRTARETLAKIAPDVADQLGVKK